jgi:signal recognition particle subunit SRP14
VTYGDSSAFPEPTGDSPFPDLAPTKPLSLIIRATDGKSKDKRPDRLKLSTIVDEEALEGFFLKYSEVCKAGMSGLKKRDRSKNKQKLKAKKKKGGAGTEEVKKV